MDILGKTHSLAKATPEERAEREASALKMGGKAKSEAANEPKKRRDTRETASVQKAEEVGKKTQAAESTDFFDWSDSVDFIKTYQATRELRAIIKGDSIFHNWFYSSMIAFALGAALEAHIPLPGQLRERYEATAVIFILRERGIISCAAVREDQIPGNSDVIAEVNKRRQRGLSMDGAQ